MQALEFTFLVDLIKQHSGIKLEEDKTYLLESRLLPVARNNGCDSLPSLIAKLRTGVTQEIIREIVEAMTTNESLFFRDSKPFDYLRGQLLPHYKAMQGKSTLRVWSAASSSGQEPYSIAMCLQEDAAKMPGWKYDIVATDIDTQMVERVKKGVYSQLEVQRGLPIQMLIKYFDQLPDTTWQIKDILRTMLICKKHNLLDSSLTLGKFDLVFCRYVLIYFDVPTRLGVLSQISSAMNPGGYLFLGSSEFLPSSAPGFQSVAECRGLYQKV